MESDVESIMSTKIETIDMLDTAHSAAKKMRDKRISSLIVVDKDRKAEPLGIITERDFVHRICAQGISSKDVTIRQLMSTPIATVDLHSTVEVAADLMLNNKVRHLLVMDENRRPVGIIAPSNLNKYLGAKIDIDEVSARILKGVIEEEEGEEKRGREEESKTAL
jgi:signal-transduction protein with cAMP-binding, CBS, and nucleotidyltransferase domain